MKEIEGEEEMSPLLGGTEYYWDTFEVFEMWKWSIVHPRVGTAAQQPPPQAQVENHRFCKHADIKDSHDLCFSLSQPLKSADLEYWKI
jgi:hypothetical protein